MMFAIVWPYAETKKCSEETINSERRLYLHLFSNDQQTADDKAAFNDLLDRLELELLSGKADPAREKFYIKYFEINKTLVRDVKLNPKQEAIDAAEKN